MASVAVVAAVVLSLCFGAREGQSRPNDGETVEPQPLCDVSTVMSGGEWIDGSTGLPLGSHSTGDPQSFKWEHRRCHPKSGEWPSSRLSEVLKDRRLLFLGDSTMGQLHKAFVSERGCFRPHRVQQDRCSLARYYGLPGAHTYPHGMKQLGEGPFKLGVQIPGCTDCSGCKSMAQRCGNGSVVEYITMEHPRDKTVSSEAFPTSQDVLLHHHLQKHPADVVVLNLGLHGMSMCSFETFKDHFPEKSDECRRQRLTIFVRDVRNLIVQLQTTTALVIWLTINSVNDSLQMESRLAYSSDANVLQFNSALESTMAELEVPVVDTYRMSHLPFAMETLHSDPVHLKGFKGLYYHELARAIALTIIENVASGNGRTEYKGRAYHRAPSPSTRNTGNQESTHTGNGLIRRRQTHSNREKIAARDGGSSWRQQRTSRRI